VIRKQPWFERTFPTGLAPALLPVVIERLRGAPARVEERVAALDARTLTRRLGDTWSIQENVGHLGDLEPLWRQRVEDFVAGRADLAPADLQNRRTTEANHNAASLASLLTRFREARAALVGVLEGVDAPRLAHTARHPRLGVPMNLVDHAFFVAEHDDYHLARITELLQAFTA
jgi:uncharacterized damage-inducible protein DinB